jgi:beta-1,4-mannosyl-glycoprotein beta-1,4-N-acetylglucosaminyltransferase
MIIDAFIFNDELDLLEARLEYLYDVVDFFVLVEADLTHSGKLKRMEYDLHRARYQKYWPKIIYHPYHYNPAIYTATPIIPRVTDYASDAFQREWDHRNAITTPLLRFKPEDIVMVSDVDEIPSRRGIAEAVSLLQTYYVGYAMLQDYCAFNLNQKVSDPWRGTVIATNQWIQAATPQRTRLNREFPTITDAGWHLTYWGGVDKIRHKLESFSHQELNLPDIKDTKHIQESVAAGKELFLGRAMEPIDIGTIYLKDRAFFNSVAKYAVPMPEFSQLVEGWFGDEDMAFYRKIAAELSSDARVVEVGSWKGRSSSLMAVSLINKHKPFQFDCVDTWEGSVEHQEGQPFQDPDVVNHTLFETFTANMKPVEGHYRAIRLPSVEAAKLYENETLDFVFVDAAHDYDNVKADIAAWLPKIKKGGIIAGHDAWYPPVKRAVEEVFWQVSVAGQCWFTQITK